MNVRTAMAVAVVAVGACLPATGQAAPPAPALHLTGNGNTHIDVTLSRSVAFDERQGRFLAWTGCGRYRGFYFRPLSPSLRPYTDTGTNGFGLLDVASFDYASGRRRGVPLGDAAFAAGDVKTLRPGRYRLFLFGEGSCTVRMPVASGVTGTWRVTTAARSAVQFAEAPLDAAGTPKAAPHAGAASLPVDVGKRDYVVAVAHTWERHRGPQDIGTGNGASACLDEVLAGTCAPTHADGRRDSQIAYEGSRTVHPDGTSESTVDTVFFFLPGDAPVGRMYGKTTAQNVTSEWTAAAAVFSFAA